MLVNESIKHIRYIARLSQEDFAKIIGCSQTAISAYEVGQRIPRYDILKRINDFAKKNKIKVDLL